MSDNKMLERLKRTEKGQMRYGRSRQESPHLKDPRSFIEIHAKTFSLNDTLVVLENCEESAHVDENNVAKERQAKSFIEKSTKSFENAKERQEPVQVIDIDQNVGQLVTYIQETNIKRTENTVSSKIGSYEYASKQMFENAKKKYSILQQKRAEKNASLQETLQRYVRDSEETANQLKLQNNEQHKSRSKILLTRIEEAENRRKLILQQRRRKEEKKELDEYDQYKALKKLLEKYETKKKSFISEKSNSKLIIAIKKAISVPLISITNRSGSDLRNQISQLNSVLQGENIKVQSECVKFDEDGLCYICLTMAQKFVKLAEDLVSSNHSAAFCLALAVIGVWSNNSDFGKLFLAQLQLRCPFVIPWYVPQLPGQYDVEYKKMSGLIRTYAAIIQSPLPPDVNQHPYGVAEGWKSIARMLNLDPIPDVTATVLVDFIEVAGHVMVKTYGKQFEKLLNALCFDYYPKIEEVSAPPPVERLKMFLKECIKKKNIPKPKGYLSDRFWFTNHPTGVVGSNI